MSLLAAWTALLLSAAAGAAFLIGGAGAVRQRRGVHAEPRVHAPESEIGQLEAEIRAALNLELRAAALRFTALEMAVQPGLPMHWDRDAFSRALRLVIRDATDRAEGGRVLVTASRHGGRVQVAVSDDATPQDREILEALLREPQQIFALMGATMEVTPQLGCGTTIAIRLPEPGPVRASPTPSAVSVTPPNASVAEEPTNRRASVSTAPDQG